MQKLEKNACLYSMMTEDLDYYDRKLLPDVKRILNNKLKKGDTTIDLVKFCEYFNVTELLARKLIYNVELNDLLEIKFIFINGHKEYESCDKVRIAKVQKKQISADT